jgi:hypothetical protein
MPAEWEYVAAARQLRAERDRILTAMSALDRTHSNPTVSGGSVATVVGASLAVSVANARRSGERLHELAALCDQRAAVCARHAATLLQWQRRVDHWDEAVRRRRLDPTLPDPGPAPPRPVAPYAWVAPR